MADYDIAVIGAGAAGLSVTYGAARLGLRVALIERGRMGGDCLNVGCVPSKALLAAAHAARDARRAGRFGVRLGAAEIDWAGVRAHVHGAIAAIEPVDSAERYAGLGATVLAGVARFVGPGTLSVDGRRLTARRIVVAAGSRPAVPSIPGLEAVPYVTNETIFDLAERPAHLLILGGGAIGLEMAQAHACLGCQVTVIEAGRIAAREDAELVDALRASLTADGVTLLEDAAVVSAAPGPMLTLADGRRIAGSHLLVATGRAASVEELGLEAGGVAFGPRGVATDAGLRSVSNRRVFAAGDIADPAGIGPRAYTHAAGYHAGIIIRRAVFRLPARLDYRALPRVIYTAPELAQVGLTAAKAEGATVLRFPLAENDRAIAEADTVGLVKLVVAGGRVVGASILAPHAGEMIGLCGLAIARRLSPAALAQLILPYPTRAEAVKRAAGSLYAERLFAPHTRRIARLLARV
jgi:pyruvate/2-oxoglutarate dehydrogenase complex dihydrolipoamide dehydrogenase (E3) component